MPFLRQINTKHPDLSKMPGTVPEFVESAWHFPYLSKPYPEIVESSPADVETVPVSVEDFPVTVETKNPEPL